MIKLANLNRWFLPWEHIIFIVTGTDVAEMVKAKGMVPLDKLELMRVRVEIVKSDWYDRVQVVLDKIKREREETYLKSL